MPASGGSSLAQQRLFVAVPCPLSTPLQAMLDELHAAQRSVGSGLRLVAADTLHLTLKFLGTTAEERIPALCAALACLAPTHDAFSVELRSVGSFHSALWLGVAPNPALLGLAQSINAAFEPLGFAVDARAFQPHVTLARLSRSPRFNLSAWLDLHRNTPWPPLAVREVHLYRSVTGPTGARYAVIHTARLRAST